MCACMRISTLVTACCEETLFCNFCIHFKSLWISKLNQSQALMLIRDIMLMPLQIKTLQVWQNIINTQFNLTSSTLVLHHFLYNLVKAKYIETMNMDYYQPSAYVWFLLVISPPSTPCSSLLCLAWFILRCNKNFKNANIGQQGFFLFLKGWAKHKRS